MQCQGCSDRAKQIGGRLDWHLRGLELLQGNCATAEGLQGLSHWLASVLPLALESAGPALWGRRLITLLKLFSFQHCDDTAQVTPREQQHFSIVLTLKTFRYQPKVQSAVTSQLFSVSVLLFFFIFTVSLVLGWFRFNDKFIKIYKFIPHHSVKS